MAQCRSHSEAAAFPPNMFLIITSSGVLPVQAFIRNSLKRDNSASPVHGCEQGEREGMSLDLPSSKLKPLKISTLP
ncbi:hypothetical protein SRHO_G00135660 [Serrasalmus rhombeus]